MQPANAYITGHTGSFIFLPVIRINVDGRRFLDAFVAKLAGSAPAAADHFG